MLARNGVETKGLELHFTDPSEEGVASILEKSMDSGSGNALMWIRTYPGLFIPGRQQEAHFQVVKCSDRAGERAQLLRTLAVLPEDLSLDADLFGMACL